MISGFVNIDKPSGITSHDVIYRLRRSTRIKRMGHTGTLDPDATGVLPVAIGPACRLIDYLSKEKIYFAEILLGTKTTTDDISGTVLELNNIDSTLNSKQIEFALQKFIGTIKQTPPLYSAVHHNGQRLHHLARQKRHSSMNAQTMTTFLSTVKQRDVHIEHIDLLDIKLPVISLRITCSAGTYIRSLARDLGEELGCGACLKSLRREKSGLFDLGQSIELEHALSLSDIGQLKRSVIPPQNVLNFKTIKLDSESTILIIKGQFLDLQSLKTHYPSEFEADEKVLLLSKYDKEENFVIALGRVIQNLFIKPEIVLFNLHEWLKLANA